MQTYDEAMADIQASVNDAIADSPDVGEDDIWHDIIVNKFVDGDVPNEVKFDLARCQLGWDPEEESDLFKQHGIQIPAVW